MFRYVQLVLATVAHQVRVENVVALDQQLSHMTETGHSKVQLKIKYIYHNRVTFCRRRPSPFSCINEYLVTDSGRNVSELSSRLFTA